MQKVLVIPAQAGIQEMVSIRKNWIPGRLLKGVFA